MFIRGQLALMVGVISNLMFGVNTELKWKLISGLFIIAVISNVGSFGYYNNRRARAASRSSIWRDHFPPPDPSLAMVTGAIPNGTMDRNERERFLQDNISSFLTVTRKGNLPRSKKTVRVEAVAPEHVAFGEKADVNFSSNRPYLDVVIAGALAKPILLDSGASLSMIPKSWIDEVEKLIGEPIPEYTGGDAAHQLNLTTVTGAPIKVQRKLLVPITIGRNTISVPMAETDSEEVKHAILGFNFLRGSFRRMNMSPTGKVILEMKDGQQYACRMGRGDRVVAAVSAVRIPAGKAVRTCLYMPTCGKKTYVEDPAKPVHIQLNDGHERPFDGIVLDQVSRVAQSGKIRVDLLNKSVQDVFIPADEEIGVMTPLTNLLEHVDLEVSYMDAEQQETPLKDFIKVACLCSYKMLIHLVDSSGCTNLGADQVLDGSAIRGPWTENVVTAFSGDGGFKMGVLNRPDRDFAPMCESLVKSLVGIRENGGISNTTNKVLIVAPTLPSTALSLSTSSGRR